MKIDMHCHVREGSVDSRVSLDEYITTLKEKGFDGMLITDHDTYHGYRHTQLAQIYGKDSRYASVINVMSVIFCIITMPVMVLSYEMLIAL